MTTLIAQGPVDVNVGRHPTAEECESAGRGPGVCPDGRFREGGLPNTPEERERFEAYMRGHCWGFGTYEDENGAYDSVFVRCLYGVWRDRGSLPTVTPNAGGKRSDD